MVTERETKMPTSIGIIGAGAIAKRHAKAAVDSNVAVRYIVDTDLARAEELAATCDASATDDLAQLLDDGEVAGVVVAVPNSLHRPLTLQAIQAGKDVLLEKPMGLTVAECDEINAAVAASERILQVGLVNRYSAVGHSAKQWIEEGKLGSLYHIKAQIYRRRGVPGLGGWFTTKSMSGGGAMIDIGVHAIDLAMHLAAFPQPKQVLGKVYNKFGCRMEDYVYEDMWAGPPRLDGVCDVDDSAHAMILLAPDISFELNVTWAGNFPTGALPESMMGFFGDQGGMTFKFEGEQLQVATESSGHNVDTTVKLRHRDQFAEQMADFAQAIETRIVRGATGEQAATVQRVIEAVYDSSKQNAAISFDSFD
jgi:predicted dehydrogenase